MKEKKYEEPKILVVSLVASDIIRTSDEDDDLTNGGSINDGSFAPKS